MSLLGNDNIDQPINVDPSLPHVLPELLDGIHADSLSMPPRGSCASFHKFFVIREWTATIGKCYSERTVNGKTSCEERYFIGSKRCSARRYGQVLRNHWRIENNLHWQMDVSFGEDGSRIQKRHGGENFALLRRLALGLLKRHPGKESIKGKRYEAALDVAFLEEVLKR